MIVKSVAYVKELRPDTLTLFVDILRNYSESDPQVLSIAFESVGALLCLEPCGMPS